MTDSQLPQRVNAVMAETSRPEGGAHPAGIVFDVDGTMYRQAPVRRAMLIQLARATLRSPRAGLRAIRTVAAYRWAQEAARAAAARPGEQASARQLRLAAERCGLPASEVSTTIAHWMEAEPLKILARHRFAGLREFLDDCRTRGIRLGVLSDYPCRDKLAALGVADLFDVVVSAFDPDVGVFKPDPAGIHVALARLGVAPGDAMFVGDRPEVDAAAAAAAGVRAVIVGGAAPSPAGAWMSVPDYGVLRRRMFG